MIISGSWISTPHPLHSSVKLNVKLIFVFFQSRVIDFRLLHHQTMASRCRTRRTTTTTRIVSFQKRIHTCHVNREQSKLTSIASHGHVRISTKRQNKPQFCGKNGISTKWLRRCFYASASEWLPGNESQSGTFVWLCASLPPTSSSFVLFSSS